MTFWSAGGPNLPALQLFLAKEFLLVRKYNTILSILLIAASAVGIHLSLNFDVRGGNVGDPGAAPSRSSDIPSTIRTRLLL